MKSYDLIAFEDLNIKSMVKNHYPANQIADASMEQANN